MQKNALKSLICVSITLFLLTVSFLSFAQNTDTGQWIGPTKVCDDLWQLAKKIRPNNSVTIGQTAIGLWQKNHEAFYEDNINGLRAGYQLVAPTLSEIQQTSAEQAIQMINAQNEAWKVIEQTLKQNPSASYLQTKQTKCLPPMLAEQTADESAVPGQQANDQTNPAIGLTGLINLIKNGENNNEEQTVSSTATAPSTNENSSQFQALQAKVQQLTQTVQQLQQTNQALVNQLTQINQKQEGLIIPPQQNSNQNAITATTLPTTFTNPAFSTRMNTWLDNAIYCRDGSCPKMIATLPAQSLVDYQALKLIFQIRGIELIGVALLLIILFLLLWMEMHFIKPANKKSTIRNTIPVPAPLTNSQVSSLAGENLYDTKLDLARVYIDMDDWESAKRLLESVVREGSSEQAKEANELLKNSNK